VVMRLPIHDDAGEVIGAIGFALFDELRSLSPMLKRYMSMQEELASTRSLLRARQTKYNFAHFIGTSAASLEVKRRARRSASTDSPVLLLGETGTGKELLAQAIHNASPRALKAFVSVNSAAIPESLLEAEFFGTAPGAFTGADRKARAGKLQIAQGGTLFLDEIGDMPLPLQSKLLRVLQEKEFEPVGSNDVIQSDVRVIAATSTDLEAAIKRGEFRADLYYRLNVLPIQVPPLRDRLDNVLERAALLSDDLRLTVADIRAAIGTFTPVERMAPLPVEPLEHETFSAARARFDRQLIETTLAQCGGKVVEAAARLGLGRSTLYKKMLALGIAESP